MQIVIEPVTNNEGEAAMLRIRQQVFEREMGIPSELLRMPEDARLLHLLARVEPNENPVAALTVIETTGHHQLHQSYGLRFDSGGRVARYTQLAVLKPYRGMNIPLMMMLEAHRRFVAPGQFHFTWLLFDAERAASSSMCRLLAFTPSAQTYRSEYGCSRALVRDERTPRAGQAIRHAEQYLEQSLKLVSPAAPLLSRQTLSV